MEQNISYQTNLTSPPHPPPGLYMICVLYIQSYPLLNINAVQNVKLQTRFIRFKFYHARHSQLWIQILLSKRFESNHRLHSTNSDLDTALRRLKSLIQNRTLSISHEFKFEHRSSTICHPDLNQNLLKVRVWIWFLNCLHTSDSNQCFLR